MRIFFISKATSPSLVLAWRDAAKFSTSLCKYFVTFLCERRLFEILLRDVVLIKFRLADKGWHIDIAQRLVLERLL